MLGERSYSREQKLENNKTLKKDYSHMKKQSKTKKKCNSQGKACLILDGPIIEEAIKSRENMNYFFKERLRDFIKDSADLAGVDNFDYKVYCSTAYPIEKEEFRSICQ